MVSCCAFIPSPEVQILRHFIKYMTSGVFLIDTECQFGAYSAKVKIWLKKLIRTPLLQN